MKRIGHIALQHTVVQEFGGGHHRQHIAGLHGEHHLVKVVLLADLQPFYGRLHHRLGCVAVATDDAIAQRTVVDADAHRRVVLLADLEQRFGSQRHTFHLGGILAVGKVQLREVALVGEVSGVHAHLVHERGHRLRHLGVEVHIRDERYVAVAVCFQLLLDLLQRFHLLEGRHGETHHLRPRVNHPFALRHGCLHIRGVGIRHRLHHHRRVPADGHIPNQKLSFTIHRFIVSS